MPDSVNTILDPEVHEQIFRSGGQSDAKPSALQTPASLVLIYRPTEAPKTEPVRRRALNAIVGVILRCRNTKDR
ncbi:hypothetical protein TNCV_1824531 [Trichonephila clavipes]|nr:hypothetical protein TNCV_1824531 [Trichonephila clavipes]